MLYYYVPFAYWFATRLPQKQQRLDFWGLFLLPQAFVCLSRGQYLALVPALIVIGCVLEISFLKKDVYLDKTLPSESTAPLELIRGHARPLMLWRAALILGSGLALKQQEGARLFFNPFLVCLFFCCVILAFHNSARGRWKLLTGTLQNGITFTLLPMLFLPDPLACILAFILCNTIPTLAFSLFKLNAGARLPDVILAAPTRFLLRYYSTLLVTAFLLSAFLPQYTAYFLPITSWYLLYYLGVSLYNLTGALRRE